MIKQVIGELFEENYIKFKHYLRSRFSELNDYDIEDIIQGTILRLLSKGDDIFSVSNLTSYVYTSLQNGAIDHFKKNNRLKVYEDTSGYFEKATETLEEQILVSELKTVIKNAIFSLDARSKYVFIETELKGRSYESLMKETGERLGTLLSRKSRARKKLQEALYNYIGR